MLDRINPEERIITDFASTGKPGSKYYQISLNCPKNEVNPKTKAKWTALELLTEIYREIKPVEVQVEDNGAEVDISKYFEKFSKVADILKGLANVEVEEQYNKFIFHDYDEFHAGPE